MTQASEKRRMRDEAEQSPSMDPKKQKFVDRNSEMTDVVGATELASAMALASLANMSPSHNSDSDREESRDADHGEEATPISPEQRSPMRTASKRVTFSTDTKNVFRQTSRKLSFPPRIPKQTSRMPAGFARPTYPTSTPLPQQLPPPQWMRQQMMYQRQHSTTNYGPPPPPPPMMPRAPPPTDKWICDFCNVAAFDTFQEACIHEETCRSRCRAPAQSRMPVPPPPPPPISSPMRAGVHSTRPPYPHSMMIPSQPSPVQSRMIQSKPHTWCQGVTSLAIPESDSDWLSGLNCFIRDHCVEAFSATHEDVSKITKRGSIMLHQVGIRCCFCSHVSKDSQQVAAVSYPESVEGIYESVKRWQKVHFNSCVNIPREARSKILELSAVNSAVPTTRQYWADSAKAVGMVNTQHGIRFSTDPKATPICVGPEVCSSAKGELSKQMLREGGSESESASIVNPGDMAMVPPYVYFLMRQVEGTRFTEADRFVARSKGPVGYPGFQCRHCNGHAGLGKYFPVSSKSLSTNSTSQNIHSHLLKCRKVPPYIQQQLVTLKEEKSKAPRLEPGWRRVFFDKIWSRLHDENN